MKPQPSYLMILTTKETIMYISAGKSSVFFNRIMPFSFLSRKSDYY